MSLIDFNFSSIPTDLRLWPAPGLGAFSDVFHVHFVWGRHNELFLRLLASLGFAFGSFATMTVQAQTPNRLYSFAGGSVLDGTQPEGNLLMDAKGTLYGTTNQGGGLNSNGTVYKVDSSGNETVLYRFTGPATGGAAADGSD